MDRPSDPPDVAVLGIPWDENSSFLRGPAEAPDAIRRALYAGSTNLCSEAGVDLGTHPRFRWLDPLALGADPMAAIEGAVADLLDRGDRVLALGGDHAISYPVLRAFGRRHRDLTVLHLDAHHDLYDEFEGNRLSHACPFARVMEDGCVARLVQVGIRTMNAHQRAQVERFGVEVIEMRAFDPARPPRLEPPVYLSIDLDVLDPAFAPGVSHHEPGGMTVREVLALIAACPAPLVGADIVELNPRRDVNDATAMVAGKLVKEVAARLLVDAPAATGA